jgi:hypothetical protein
MRGERPKPSRTPGPIIRTPWGRLTRSDRYREVHDGDLLAEQKAVTGKKPA